MDKDIDATALKLIMSPELLAAVTELITKISECPCPTAGEVQRLGAIFGLIACCEN